ncbi:Adenylate-forming reductase Nps9 [Colletotrichum sp. SAR11_59]|nr:Adenylate-forming reductase Nps9 [Colletotrichum sp. SAR11_59]
MATQITTTSSKLTVSELDRPLYTVDELVRRRALEIPDAVAIGYPKEGLLDFEEHSFRAIDRYVDAAAQRLQELGVSPAVGHLETLTRTFTDDEQDPALEQSPVVGILAQSGLHVAIAIMALNRLGCAAFLISTRLASPAITRLCELANCSSMLTTPNFHPVLSEVQKQRQLEVLPLIQHSDYYGKEAPRFTRSYDSEKENKKIMAIIHSSGSTGLPKPIYLTHRSVIGASMTNMGLRAFICSPLFHSHGFYEIFRSMYSKLPIYMANYNIPLTSQNLIKMLDYVKPGVFHVIPTEIGRIMNSVRPAGDKGWNYMRPLAVAKPYILMDEISPGIFECVCLDGWPSKSTNNSDDPPNSFRTRDLFTRHPTQPDMWKYISRLDDRFTLINGEKVLPIPIEGRIRLEQIVKEAIVFGEQRDYPGVLIVKADSVADMPDEQFLEEIWPAVEAANAQAESFSRIPKELVVILPSDAEYPKTDKGTFIRVPFYRKFEKEIQAAYDGYENENDKGGSLSLEGADLENWLFQQLNEKSENALPSVEADFFASGIDSLLCIQTWSLIKRKLDLGGRQGQLGQNVLYETGNIKQLARHLEGLKSGREDAVKDELEKMEELIAKYSSFKTHVPGSTPKPAKDLVLVTGVTGGLGAHILAQLTSLPNIAQVYAAVRAPNDAAATTRVSTSLSSRGITLTPAQEAKIVPLSADLGTPDFGLAPSRLADLKSNLTLVIHSAWAVNFNIPVQSFEDQHIKAVYNLIQLCQSVDTPSPARFFFCSSVSSAGGTPRPGTVEEGPVPTPKNAQGTGYARSKYVSEHITRNANKSAGAAARVLRIGQLVGDSKVGEWNTTEGIPLMIQTAATLGALPKLEEEMSWLPVDLAAAIILDMTNADRSKSDEEIARRDSDADLVYHVLNPTRFHWAKQMLPSLAKAGLEFEALPTDQWMERLRSSERDPKKNPPIKLLDWFESKYGNKASTFKGGLEYLTEESKKDSPTLRSLPDVTDVAFVRMMIDKLKARWEAGA